MLKSLLIFISLIFIFFSHPMLMGLGLLMSALLISMMLNYFGTMVWVSYVLVMVFLGGLMVLFMYVCSLSLNESPVFHVKAEGMVVLFLSLLALFFFVFLASSGVGLEMQNSLIKEEWWLNTSSMNVSLMYSELWALPMIYVIFYLLLTLVVSVVVCMEEDGKPLRVI